MWKPIPKGALLDWTLPEKRLRGVIPPEIGTLNNLQHLNLSANRLSGSIPT